MKKIIIPIIALAVAVLGVGCFFAVKYKTTTVGDVLNVPKNSQLVKVVVSSDIEMNPNAIHVEVTDAENLEKFSEILDYKARFSEKNEYSGTSTNLTFYFSDDSTRGLMLAGDTRFKANGNLYVLTDKELNETYIKSFFSEN